MRSAVKAHLTGFGVRCQASGVSSAAGKRTAGLIGKETSKSKF